MRPQLPVGARYKEFLVTKSLPLAELSCHLVELEHEPTGAHVIHIAADDPENLFCLSLRTLPANSHGTPHILEHTVLCGSQRYPVKDPFFSMNRRSLNTFMNALTGQDFTCYPAASQVEQDFYNLLQVYIDAVFHPLLDPLSFAQEGHRLEFATPNDPTTALEYRGVVYNEMKGTLASPGTRLQEALIAQLFPNSPYGYNSGGDPADIPSLPYEELVQFHREHYHPSRCLFFTYGDLPLEKHLDVFQEQALKGVAKLPPLPLPPKQPRFTEPVRTVLPYPAPAEEEPDEPRAFVSCAFLTAPAIDHSTILGLSLLDSILMDTDASLLKRELLASGLCKQASSSLATDVQEVPYTITTTGCKPESADAIESLIRATLTTIAAQGIPPDLVESALHQLEFARTEITSNGTGPFGLTLFARAGLFYQQGGHAEDGLRIHTLFTELRALFAEKPHFLSTLITTYMLSNPHFVRITLVPSTTLADEERTREQGRLQQIRTALTPEQIDTIVAQSQALMTYQEQAQTTEKLALLPMIALADVPAKSRDFPITRQTINHLECFHHAAFTNHITYATLLFPLPALQESDLWVARLFTSLIPQVGAGSRSYQENLEYIQAHTGGIGADFALYTQVENSDRFTPSLYLRGKALTRKADKLFALFFETVTALNLSDYKRLRELVLKHFSNLQESLPYNALRYAMSLASSGMNEAHLLGAHWYGLDYYCKIRHLARNFHKEFDELLSRLEAMQKTLFCNEGAHLVVTCDAGDYAQEVAGGFGGLVDLPAKAFTTWKTTLTPQPVPNQGRILATPVASLAEACRVVAYAHPDSPALAVASQLFENTTLHVRIREQGGAYGGGASYSAMSGSLYFYAHSDPNIASSLAAFQEAIEKVAAGCFSSEELDEAKLCFIQALDTPVPPGSRADVAYTYWREGRTLEMRQAFRNRLLALTTADVQAAVQTHVIPAAKQAVFAALANKELLERENSKLTARGLPSLKIEKI